MRYTENDDIIGIEFQIDGCSIYRYISKNNTTGWLECERWSKTNNKWVEATADTLEKALWYLNMLDTKIITIPNKELQYEIF